MGRRISHGGNPSFFARVRNQTAVRAVLKAERREAHGGTLAGTGGPGGAVRRDALPAGLRPHRLPGGRGGREGHAERADVEAVFRAAAGEPAGV